MALSDTAIRNLKVPSKPTKISDDRGLFLLLTPSGGKLWRFKYRFDRKEAVDLDHDLTRIEVTLRKTKKTLGQFSTLCDPFGNLLVVRKSSVIALQKKCPTSIELNVFAKGLLAGGVAQNIYLDMDSYSRKLLLKRLKPIALNLNGTAENWKGWVKRQVQMLESRFLGKGT